MHATIPIVIPVQRYNNYNNRIYTRAWYFLKLKNTTRHGAVPPSLGGVGGGLP